MHVTSSADGGAAARKVGENQRGSRRVTVRHTSGGGCFGDMPRDHGPQQNQTEEEDGGDELEGEAKDKTADGGRAKKEQRFQPPRVDLQTAFRRADFSERRPVLDFDTRSPLRVGLNADLKPGQREEFFSDLHRDHEKRMERLEDARSKKTQEQSEAERNLTPAAARKLPWDDIDRITKKLYDDHRLKQRYMQSLRDEQFELILQAARRNYSPRRAEEADSNVELYDLKDGNKNRTNLETLDTLQSELRYMEEHSVHRNASGDLGMCCERLYAECERRAKRAADRLEKQRKADEKILRETSVHRKVSMELDKVKKVPRQITERLYGNWKAKQAHTDQMTKHAEKRHQRGRTFGVDVQHGTERFNQLYSDAFRRADDRRIEIERQEAVRRHKHMLASVHTVAQLKLWTRDQIDELTDRMVRPRRRAHAWVSTPTKHDISQSSSRGSGWIKAHDRDSDDDVSTAYPSARSCSPSSRGSPLCCRSTASQSNFRSRSSPRTPRTGGGEPDWLLSVHDNHSGRSPSRQRGDAVVRAVREPSFPSHTGRAGAHVSQWATTTNSHSASQRLGKLDDDAVSVHDLVGDTLAKRLDDVDSTSDLGDMDSQSEPDIKDIHTSLKEVRKLMELVKATTPEGPRSSASTEGGSLAMATVAPKMETKRVQSARTTPRSVSQRRSKASNSSATSNASSSGSRERRSSRSVSRRASSARR